MCIKQVGPRSCEVMCGERIYRRNQRDLRKTAETFADIRETQLKYQYSGIQKADIKNLFRSLVKKVLVKGWC